MNKQEKMIEVVKKLMALSQNNPSQEEALSAALKAQELMAKYNISEAQLGEKLDSTTINSSSFNFKGNINDCDNHKWKYNLAHIVANNFRCEVYVTGSHIINFFGYEQDAKVAVEVFGTLYKIGDRLGRRERERAKKLYKTVSGVYNSFILGFLKGLEEALEKQCTALMIVTPKEVKEQFTDMTARWTKKASKVQVSNYSANAYNNGVVEGHNAVEQRQLTA